MFPKLVYRIVHIRLYDILLEWNTPIAKTVMTVVNKTFVGTNQQ